MQAGNLNTIFFILCKIKLSFISFVYTFFSVTKTYNEQDVKVEVDFLGNWKFVSTIEVENQLPLSLHSTSFNKDEVQSFVCNLCHDSFTSKKRIIHHLQKFHKTNCKTTKKISRNKFR